MKQTKLVAQALFAALLMLAACTGDKQAAELRGHLPAGIDEDLQVSYTLTGSLMDAVYLPLSADSTGLFTFSLGSLPVDQVDICIGVDRWVYGAHLERGKSLDVYFTREAEGKEYAARFEGEHSKLSRYLTLYQQAFDVMKYFSPDPDEAKSIEEYRQVLEEERQKMAAATPLLDGLKEKEYYLRLTDGMYRWTKIRIMMDQANEENRGIEEYPEFYELTDGIDPNDPINLSTNLIGSWLTAMHRRHKSTEEDQAPFYIESLQIIDSLISEPSVKSALIHQQAYIFFNYSDGKSDKEAFWQFYKEFAKEYPQFIAEFEPMASAKSATAGEAMPYDPTLTRPDGTTCKLSSLYGSLLYIDFWATWCAPCCKEIPHLERRAQQYKNNSSIRFVSISMDSDRDAWLAKLANDKPTWEQFILSGEENQRLSEALQITGIPRFILLDANGNLIDNSAPRPSNDDLVQLIDKNL